MSGREAGMAANNPQTLKIVSLILKLCAMIPALIGLGLLLGAGFTGKNRYTIVKAWPTADAEVTRSELARHQEKFGNNANPTTVYQALIDLRYSVGGKEYTSPTGTNYSTSDYAEIKGKVDAFAPGTHHPIRYNPANPSDIRRDAGFTLGFFLAPIILLVTGTMFGGGGVVLFWAGWAVGRAKVQCPSCGHWVSQARSSCPDCGALLPHRHVPT
jgi:hypothetical protein